MTFRFHFLPEAEDQLRALKYNRALEKRFKAVKKALRNLQLNPRHPGLNIHAFTSMSGPHGEKIWEAYAENNTPGAYRIFFFYGPEKEMISIFSIIPHP
jgi:hypothetical protein